MEKIKKHLTQALKSIQLASIEAKRLTILGKTAIDGDVDALGAAISEEIGKLVIK